MSYADAPVPAAWADLDFFVSGRAREIAERLDGEEGVLPAARDLYAALAATSPDKVKAVILGQDPYPTPGHAHGLAFSYRGEGPLPMSLRNILRELRDDTGVERESGDLSGWAGQGVLLLNTALSVRKGEAGSHRRYGWKALTEEVIGLVGRGRGCAFVLWGRDAGEYERLVPAKGPHLALKTVHPSPLSVHRGFFGSRPFSKVNEYLENSGRTQIDWSR